MWLYLWDVFFLHSLLKSLWNVQYDLVLTDFLINYCYDPNDTEGEVGSAFTWNSKWWNSGSSLLEGILHLSAACAGLQFFSWQCSYLVLCMGGSLMVMVGVLNVLRPDWCQCKEKGKLLCVSIHPGCWGMFCASRSFLSIEVFVPMWQLRSDNLMDKAMSSSSSLGQAPNQPKRVASWADDSS